MLLVVWFGFPTLIVQIVAGLLLGAVAMGREGIPRRTSAAYSVLLLSGIIANVIGAGGVLLNLPW